MVLVRGVRRIEGHREAQSSQVLQARRRNETVHSKQCAMQSRFMNEIFRIFKKGKYVLKFLTLSILPVPIQFPS